MNVLNNIPVFFEDYNNQSERQKQGFYELIMGVANGCGTQRSNKNLSLREQFTWSLAAVMNSEKRISPTFQTGGARARVLECKAEAAFPWRDEDDVPMAGEIMNFFSCNYGHGGRRYTDILLEIGEEKIREIFTKFLRKLQMSSSKAKFADKQATNAAIFMTADYIAAKYLFQDGIMFTVDEVLDFMTDETEADPNSQFYDYIMEQFHRNEANFEGTLLYKRMSFHTQFWGIYQSESQKDGQLVEYVCILRSCLDDMAKNQDVDLTMFFDWLRQKNLLNADNGRNTRCITRRDSATRVRLVKIRMPQEKEEIETEDENEFASIEVLQPISDDDEFVSDEEWPFPDENSPVQQEEKIISDNSSDENIAQEYMQFDIADADPMHVCG